MPLSIIEINGSGISVHSDGGMLLESPACATVDGTHLLLGKAAQAKARLNPTETNTHFWDQLTLDSLPKPFFNARHHADIAYWHIAHVWERIKADSGEVVVALPGSFNDTQLGLVLGITQTLEIPVKGLVDAALAASDTSASHAPTQLHLDIQLHRAVLTRLALDTGLIRRVGIKQRVGTGMLALYQIWMDALRDEFVRLTRFDPMHQAQTEQQLYTILQDQLLRFTHGESLPVQLSFKGKVYAISLNGEDLIRCASETYDRVFSLIDPDDLNVDAVEIHLSHRIWSLPGLTERLTERSIGNMVIRLDPHAVAKATTMHYAQICKAAGPLHFVTSLPRTAVNKPTEEQGAVRDAPTHILYRSLAYRISERPLTLGAQTTVHSANLHLRGPLNGVSRRHCSIYARESRVWIEDHSTYGTFLNEQKIQGRTLLHTGDKVRIGTPGEELLLIAEVDPHAA